MPSLKGTTVVRSLRQGSMDMAPPRHIIKTLSILFIIAVCIYFLPRVAINAFYYPNNEFYGPEPHFAESITFTAKDGTRLHGWVYPFIRRTSGTSHRDGSARSWQRGKYVGTLVVRQLATRTQR